MVFWIPPGTESAWMQPTGPWRDVFIGRMKELTAAGVDGIWADVPQYADLSHEWNGIGQYDSAAFLQVCVLLLILCITYCALGDWHVPSDQVRYARPQLPSVACVAA